MTGASDGFDFDAIERIDHKSPEIAALEERVLEALRSVFDPEIPVNIVELGLVYGLNVEPSGAVAVQMTLTAPNCPVAETMPNEVKRVVAAVAGVSAATVELTFTPPWDPSRMSEEARLELGML